jgi:anaerobic magnesium-protoporphyrin IX monomethyl ester cyclase
VTDLVVIHPGAAHGIYGPLGDTLTAVEPPLWARIIAGYVRDRGYSVKIIDAEAEGLSSEEVAARVVVDPPRLVCIAVYGHQPSASTQQMVGARAIAYSLTGSASIIPVIMVGGHVSALPETTLEQEPIDYACVGEGPITVERLLAGDPIGSIPGLVWWERGAGSKDADNEDAVRINPAASLVEDLGAYHGDTWDLLPMERYRAHNWQCFGDLGARQPYASIYTSLGCPWKCHFCCINAPFDSNRYRMRDSEEVIAEVDYLYREYGVKTFKIVDEMFVLNERHYTEICEGIARLPFSHELNFWAYARVDTIRPDKLALLRRAGFRWLALGIESGSKYVRDGAQKRLKNDDILGVVRAIQAAEINVIGNYIFGLPDDDQKSMMETLELALELNTEFANFYCAMAYPGSPLYREAVQKGWTLPGTWRGYSQHNDDCRPLDTLKISAARVLAFRDVAFNDYFSNPRYIDMISRKFGQDTLEHVRGMTKYVLKRKLLEESVA